MRHLGVENQDNRRRLNDESMNLGSFNDQGHIDASRLLRKLSEKRESMLDQSQNQIPLM